MASLVKVPQLRDYLMGEFLDSDIAATLKQELKEGDIAILMGAGNVNTIAKLLVD